MVRYPISPGRTSLTPVVVEAVPIPVTPALELAVPVAVEPVGRVRMGSTVLQALEAVAVEPVMTTLFTLTKAGTVARGLSLLPIP